MPNDPFAAYQKPAESDDPFRSYQSPTSEPQTQPTHTIAARPDNATTWFEDLGDDLRHGSGNTFVGRGLRAMGAHGLESGYGGGHGPNTSAEIMGSPLLGAATVGKGISEIPSTPARGVKDITNGAAQVMTIPGAFAGAANPIAAIRAAVPALVAGHGASRVAGALGASPDQQDALGNVAGVVGGSVASSPKASAFIRGAAQAVPSAVRESLSIPHTVRGIMDKKLPIGTALASGVGYEIGKAAGDSTGHPIVGRVLGTAAGAGLSSVPAIFRGGIAAASDKPWAPSGLFPVAPRERPQPLMLPRGPITVEPQSPPPGPDTSFVRGAPAMAHPPNPARALPAPGRTVVTQPPPESPSFVRGVPAMTHPPNPARAIAAAPRTLITMPPPDASFVRGVPAEYPPQVMTGPLTPAESVLPASGPVSEPRTFANGGIKNNTRRRK